MTNPRAEYISGGVADPTGRCVAAGGSGRLPGFWGKFVVNGPRWLPLAAHCLDVALVFRGLCDLTGIRRSLKCAAGGTPLSETQLDRLSVLAMLHDLGKANLGFQRKVFDCQAVQAGHIRELEPLFDFEDESLRHGLLSALPDGMESWFSDDESAYSYFLAAFSHHGRPLMFKGEKTGNYWPARKRWWHPDGSMDPIAAIAEIVHWSEAAFPHAYTSGESPLPSHPAFHHRFAGLVMLADWLGSHPYWFPVEEVSLEERLRHGRETVPRLLRAVGLDSDEWRAALRAQQKPDFRSRFGFDPRPLQRVVDELDPHDANTKLVIAESETGSGKTEAALNWFFKLFEAGKVDSLYFALPTRVAARELYERMRATIERWFPEEFNRPVTVLGVPGYALADGIKPETTLPDAEQANRWQDDADLRRRERQWAAELPKRFLAATVAVGTVDQALLSSIQTAHAHLRSACLDRSLLVIDEVHASDVYMARLLRFLLSHHQRVGGHAMLLSATLGSAARRQYVSSAPQPSAGNAGDSIFGHAVKVPYPSITLLDGTTRATPGTPSRGKDVRFHVIPAAFQPSSIIDRVIAALRHGARVLVVMNTVARANDMLRAFESHRDMDQEWLFHCHGVITPHHGRFAPEDRLVLDKQVSIRLGAASRPGPLLLIGTQTLEQSLDIDADLVVSDLAPADVLLQRIGRLHRHVRTRPPGYDTPSCLLLVPEEDLAAALDERGRVAAAYKQLGFGSVYEDVRSLELTWKFIAERHTIRIPRDNRLLVETATHPERLAALTDERWARHGQAVEGGDLARAIAAANATAVYNEYFGQFEFNEAGGKVVTRLGADSLQLPLNRPFDSPLGVRLTHIVIPGHMAPGEAVDVVTVKETVAGRTVLECDNRTYTYSRFGLELMQQ